MEKYYKDLTEVNCITKSGYFDVSALIDDRYPFLFCVGGRGTGKTYSTLKYLKDKRHIFIRRTKEDIETLVAMDNADSMTVSESPWRQLNEDLGIAIKAFKITAGRYMFKDIGDVTRWNDKDITGVPLANIVALSQAGKVKGAGYENVEYIFFDEFIPVLGTRDIKNDGFNIQQIYETVSRNRELRGLSPCKLLCMANASTIANPIFLEFGLVNSAYNMLKEGYLMYENSETGVRIVMLPNDGDYTQKKKQTALYKAIPKTSRMYQISIENRFTEDDFHDVKEKFDIRSYRHYAYITVASGKVYTLYDAPRNMWRMEEGVKGKGKNPYNWDLRKIEDRLACMKALICDTLYDYMEGKISFDSYETKVLYLNLIDKLGKTKAL